MQNVLSTRHASARLPRTSIVLAWILQAAAAAVFLFAAFQKLGSDPMMVQVFEAIGAGQWFRYLTGTLELFGGLGLLVPQFAPAAAALLVPVMAGAVITHLFIIGGSPVFPAVLLIALGAVIYLRREQVPVFQG
jgi:putative oxidoreductase